MTDLIKPDFVFGSEERFSNFIKELNEDDKIALVSHTDLDGIASAKIVNSVVKAHFIKFVNYNELNSELIDELKNKKINKIIFTDLYFKKEDMLKEIEKFAEILLIDHHPAIFDANSERTIFLNAQGFCGTYISYYLFSKIENIEKFDWLVACASLADFCYWKNQPWMSEIYKKYNDEFIIEGAFVRKNGKMWDLQYNLSMFLIYYDENLTEAYEKITSDIENVENLEKYSSLVLEEIDESLKRFENEKIEIDDGFFWEISPKYHIKSILINDISSKYLDKTIIVASVGEKVYHMSARRQDGKVDTNKLMRDLVAGFENCDAGGHAKATGGYIQFKDVPEFKKRLGI